jgi:hypothetical protein
MAVLDQRNAPFLLGRERVRFRLTNLAFCRLDRGAANQGVEFLEIDQKSAAGTKTLQLSGLDPFPDTVDRKP